MRRTHFFRILAGLLIFIIVLFILKTILIEPLVKNKIEAKLNEKVRDYVIEIGNVDISMLPPGIKIEKITLDSKQQEPSTGEVKGTIDFIKLKGIGLLKAIFKNNIDIDEITISNCIIDGNVSFHGKVKPPVFSPVNLRIGNLLFDKLDVTLGDITNAQAYRVKKGIFKLSDINVGQYDTLSPGIVNQIDLTAERFTTITSDSLYSFTVSHLNYSATSGKMTADSVLIDPNYTNYEFAARNEYETDRIEATLSNIVINDFSVAGYLKDQNIESSYIEIGKMEAEAFRDKRKKIRHLNKPMLQDAIYNYPGSLRIDSIGIMGGNITYIEHAEKANQAGNISFKDLKAKIYKITNDTIRTDEETYLRLDANALLMGSGRMSVILKAAYFDKSNSFKVVGNLTGMNVSELNPMLSNNAFIYANSGKIDAMNFSFTANNAKATGQMQLLYHGLNISVKNKQTDETGALRERVMSSIANFKLLDSNPKPEEPVRIGLIDYERDPERFIFNYCIKALLTGIKSSIVQPPKQKKKGRR